MNDGKFKKFSKLLQEQMQVRGAAPGSVSRALIDQVISHAESWLDPVANEINTQELIKIWVIRRAQLYMEQLTEDALEEAASWLPAGRTPDDYEPAELFKLMLESSWGPSPESIIEYVEDGVREELGWAVRHAGNQIIAALGKFDSLDDVRQPEPLLDADKQVFSPAQEKARGTHQAGSWDF